MTSEQDAICKPIIEAIDIHTSFGEHVVHNGVSFQIRPGEVVALIGGSGSGKSTLLREVIGLQRPTRGKMTMFGRDIWAASSDELRELQSRVGVLFQNSALFSALTAGENIEVPLVEQTKLSASQRYNLTLLRLALVRLDKETYLKMPSELSGGMRKRVGLARALVLDPELLFLDEPTSGLDPISARAFDNLIRTLVDSLGLTVMMVTHDLDSLFVLADRVIVLGDGKLLADGPTKEVAKSDHPWIKEYFSSRSAA